MLVYLRRLAAASSASPSPRLVLSLWVGGCAAAALLLWRAGVGGVCSSACLPGACSRASSRPPRGPRLLLVACSRASSLLSPLLVPPAPGPFHWQPIRGAGYGLGTVAGAALVLPQLHSHGLPPALSDGLGSPCGATPDPAVCEPRWHKKAALLSTVVVASTQGAPPSAEGGTTRGRAWLSDGCPTCPAFP